MRLWRRKRRWYLSKEKFLELRRLEAIVEELGHEFRRAHPDIREARIQHACILAENEWERAVAAVTAEEGAK